MNSHNSFNYLYSKGIIDGDLWKWGPDEGKRINCTYKETPATQFWEKYVLEITPQLPEPGDLGGFNFGLPLCLAFSWLVVFLCLMKGVKSSGKVSENFKEYSFFLAKNLVMPVLVKI